MHLCFCYHSVGFVSFVLFFFSLSPHYSFNVQLFSLMMDCICIFSLIMDYVYVSANNIDCFISLSTMWSQSNCLLDFHSGKTGVLVTHESVSIGHESRR